MPVEILIGVCLCNLFLNYHIKRQQKYKKIRILYSVTLLHVIRHEQTFVWMDAYKHVWMEPNWLGKLQSKPQEIHKKIKPPANGFLGRSAGDQGFEAVEPVQFQGEPRFELLLLASNLAADELHLHLLPLAAAAAGICRHLNYCYCRARQEL